MEIKEFAKKVCNAVSRELGESYRIELKEVRKNNGVILHGLMILSQPQNVAPTIYLDSFWEDYEQGTTLAEIIRRLLAIYRRDVPEGRIDLDFFHSFEKVKDRICYRLIGRARNEELLEDVPYLEFLDLALCFYYAYQGESLGEGTILIHNSHVKMWNTGTAELLRLAAVNTPELFPWVCNSMGEVFHEIMGDGEGDCGEEREPDSLPEIPMKVLSNVKRMHGAVCMLYPEVLEKLAAEEQCDFYILPSSVHEVILLRDAGWGSPEDLKKMIAEVNSTQVAPEEVLSDSLYYYDFAGKRVRMV